MKNNITASESAMRQNDKYNNFRHISGNFLSKTNPLDLHVDLTNFLIDIDEAHQEEKRRLNEVIGEIIKAGRCC